MSEGRENVSFVALRGNRNGPFAKYENRQDYISTSITESKLECCIDLWRKGGRFYSGQHEPKYLIDRHYVEEFPDFLWCVIHDKDTEIELVKLFEFRSYYEPDCEEQEIRCVSGDNEGDLIVFPAWGQEIEPDVVCVQPELNGKIQGLWLCKIIITDFPEYYSIVHDVWTDQKRVRVDSMQIDELLTSPKIDDRRSLSLYTLFDDWRPSEDGSFESLMSDLKETFPEQCVFEVDSETYQLHHLFCHIIGVEQFHKQYSHFEKYHKAYDRIINDVLPSALPYKISFRGLYVTNGGLCLIGWPSLDINVWRGQLEKRFQRKALIYMRQVANTASVMVMKFAKPVSPDKLRAFCQKYQETYFGELVVSKLTMGVCSIRMQQREMQLLKEWKAEEGTRVTDNIDRRLEAIVKEEEVAKKIRMENVRPKNEKK